MPPWVPRAIALFFAGVVALWALHWMFFALRSLLIMLALSLISLYFPFHSVHKIGKFPT